MTVLCANRGRHSVARIGQYERRESAESVLDSVARWWDRPVLGGSDSPFSHAARRGDSATNERGCVVIHTVTIVDVWFARRWDDRDHGGLADHEYHLMASAAGVELWRG